MIAHPTMKTIGGRKPEGLEMTSKWRDAFDERQQKEITFSRVYAEHYHHGTDGHNGKMIIAKMADLLDETVDVRPPLEDIAASAYRAYAASTGNKNYQGLPMPEWKNLTDAIRTAWQAAVSQAIDVSRGGSYGLDTEQKWTGWKPA